MLDINLKQLEVFVTTAEYGSFTQAAAVLYLSQSTVSSHIRGLEETLGTPLFDRSAKRKVALTESGKRIYPTAREIVDRCRVLQKALPETVGAVLTVGASTVPAQALVPRLLADFARQRPDCQFLLRRGDSARVHELLREGQIAVGFVGMRMDEKAFRYVPLAEDHLVLAAENSPVFSPCRGMRDWTYCCTSRSLPERRIPAPGWKRKNGSEARASRRRACTFWRGWKILMPSARRWPGAWVFRCCRPWWWRRTRRQAACGPLSWAGAPGGSCAWCCRKKRS